MDQEPAVIQEEELDTGNNNNNSSIEEDELIIKDDIDNDDCFEEVDRIGDIEKEVRKVETSSVANVFKRFSRF